MESITKNRQPLETLQAMIERAYGSTQVPGGDDFAEEITHGWFNVIYRIRLRDGRQVVLKIAPPGHVAVLTREQDMMRTELAAMALVRRPTAVPVPRVDHADLSRELIDAGYFFMDYVDADNFGRAQLDPLVARFGRTR
ncbi:phosphotransferase [Nonomuraea sp. NPDC049419]|uniref:phosphotransferase family protein n=1 Tax=Nonomuraea sp. NPDC049419 TaxID=3155772 RepID=UPI00341BA519